MQGNRQKIVVVMTNSTLRLEICSWLSQVGHGIYECREPRKLGVLIARTNPDLVVMDGKEPDATLSGWLLKNQMTSQTYHLLQLPTALDQSTLCALVQDSLRYGRIMKQARAQSQRQVQAPGKSAVIEKAKAKLIAQGRMSENQAYAYLRKHSMDQCLPLETICLQVLR